MIVIPFVRNLQVKKPTIRYWALTVEYRVYFYFSENDVGYVAYKLESPRYAIGLYGFLSSENDVGFRVSPHYLGNFRRRRVVVVRVINWFKERSTYCSQSRGWNLRFTGFSELRFILQTYFFFCSGLNQTVSSCPDLTKR